MDSWPWKRLMTTYKLLIFYIRCHKSYFLPHHKIYGFSVFPYTHTHI